MLFLIILCWDLTLEILCPNIELIWNRMNNMFFLSREQGFNCISQHVEKNREFINSCWVGGNFNCFNRLCNVSKLGVSFYLENFTEELCFEIRFPIFPYSVCGCPSLLINDCFPVAFPSSLLVTVSLGPSQLCSKWLFPWGLPKYAIFYNFLVKCKIPNEIFSC